MMPASLRFNVFFAWTLCTKPGMGAALSPEARFYYFAYRLNYHEGRQSLVPGKISGMQQRQLEMPATKQNSLFQNYLKEDLRLALERVAATDEVNLKTL
ncbi:hypothetical protein C1N53_21375 [Pontibacter sp. SGAir0037]|nr:hypothetical protein C1N53_21375 [Pontibacter sp. SGAir0037]